jgi:hypothetical protein
VADTLRNHHGMRHLNLPERVADRYVYESLADEDRFHAALPGDDITNHPGNVYASNPFMNRSPLRVRRILVAGKLDPYPTIKKYAQQYLVLTGDAKYVRQDDDTFLFVLHDSVNGRPGF